MAITKSLIKRMSNPNSVKPEQHKHYEKNIKLVEDVVLEKIEQDLEKFEDLKPEVEKTEVPVETINRIDKVLEEILGAITDLNDKYDNIKDNMELVLSDLQDLNIRVSDLKPKEIIEKPRFFKRIFKWQ